MTARLVKSGEPGRGASALRRWLPAAALVVLVVAVYGATVGHAFIWDDDANLTRNPTMESPAGIVRIWTEPQANQQYYPLTHTSFWIQRRLLGLAPWVYHLSNILMHAIAVLLVFALLRRLEAPGAWLAAAIFAVHPLQVETVAWVTERKNLLAAAFLFAAAWLYLWRAGVLAVDAKPPAAARWIAPGLFALALLSKTAVATAPAALLAVIWWKRGRLTRRDLLDMAPPAAASLTLGLLTAALERRHLWVEGDIWTPGLIERFLVAGRVVWFYLGKFVWPSNQVFIYPRWEIDPARLSNWLAPLAALIALAALWFARGRLGRGVAAAALVYGALIAPASGFFYVYFFQFSYVQDHFQYFACVAPSALLAAALARGLHPRAVRVGVSAALLVALGVLSWRRAGVFRDSETLWLDTIQRNPRAWMAQYNLGVARVEAGRIAEGKALYEAALAANPRFPHAHFNLALALEAQGQFDAALAHYRDAVRLRPAYASARNNLANLLLRLGRLGEALAHYDAAIAADPALAGAHFNRGVTLSLLGRRAEAAAALRRALELRPGWPEAAAALAQVERPAGGAPP